MFTVEVGAVAYTTAPRFYLMHVYIHIEDM